MITATTKMTINKHIFTGKAIFSSIAIYFTEYGRFFMFLLLIIFASCSNSVIETVTYKINEPVFVSTSEFRQSVKVLQEPRSISSTGKICYYEGYLFIAEPSKGIHIIDDRNPNQPSNIGYIELTGNGDISIKDNLLYADSYIDLVWFDITDPRRPILKGRLQNVFTTALPLIDNEFGFDYDKCYPANGKDSVIVGWKLVEKTENLDSYKGGWYWNWNNETATSFNQNGQPGSSSGINGSMSKFALYNNKLYSVLNGNMNIFDLSNGSPEKKIDNIYIGPNIETIFSYKDNLFLGSTTGLIIYSVADPLNPVYKSRITHALGCDPVVVDNDLAYITIHSGDKCGQNTNELFIVDVKDVSNPKQIASYTNLKNPKGLSISENTLFLCDDGLKIFKITTPEALMSNQVYHSTGLNGYDIISFDSVLIVMADDGLYQYNYSGNDASSAINITLLSKIPFAQ